MSIVIWKDKQYQVDVLIHLRTSNISLVFTNVDTKGELFPDEFMVSIPHRDLGYGEIAINNFDDKAGVLDALVDSEFVKSPHRYLRLSFKDTTVDVPVVVLNIPFTDLDKITGFLVQDSHTNTKSAKPADNN